MHYSFSCLSDLYTSSYIYIFFKNLKKYRWPNNSVFKRQKQKKSRKASEHDTMNLDRRPTKKEYACYCHHEYTHYVWLTYGFDLYLNVCRSHLYFCTYLYYGMQ